MGELVKLYVNCLPRLSYASSNRSSCSSGVTGIPRAYHTSIVVFGKKYSYDNKNGVTRKPLHEVVRKPDRVDELGRTRRRMSEFEKFVDSLESIFKVETYELLLRNCQHFCTELCEYLGVKGIPEDITTLPKHLRDTFGTETGLAATVGAVVLGSVTSVLALFGILLFKGLRS